jgi:hypothetical protein
MDLFDMDENRSCPTAFRKSRVTANSMELSPSW